MIQCRGRNGWFNLHEAEGYMLGDQAAVRIVSKRPFMDMPPIYFSGPMDEVVALLDSLKSQILAEQAEKEGRGKAA